MRACPAVPLDFLTADLATQEVVIIGDIRDKRWLKISLAWPFRGVLHSPPCTSFSGGGNALGLQAEDGQLMLQDIGRRCWKAKRESFAADVEESWKKKSGSLAYRLIKDRPHPPVLEMEVCSSVKLRPQRWLPDGKQWIQLLPGHGFQVGDCLSGKIDCKVVEVMDTSIRLDRKVSRTEAASLAKTEVSLDPAVWSHSFFLVGVSFGSGRVILMIRVPGRTCWNVSLGKRSSSSRRFPLLTGVLPWPKLRSQL